MACLLPAAVAAASAPADGFEMGLALVGFKSPGPKADAAPRKAGDDTGEGLDEAAAVAACCWTAEGFGATGGRTERFSVIDPSTVGPTERQPHRIHEERVWGCDVMRCD